MSNLKSADAWNHAVAVSFAIVWNKLAVTVVVGPLLGYRVKNELDIWVEGRMNCLFNLTIMSWGSHLLCFA